MKCSVENYNFQSFNLQNFQKKNVKTKNKVRGTEGQSKGMKYVVKVSMVFCSSVATLIQILITNPYKTHVQQALPMD